MRAVISATVRNEETLDGFRTECSELRLNGDRARNKS
jgi:hypothetical protein